jgi:hypothetical protein
MDDDDKGPSVSGWATANSVGLAGERFQRTGRGKDLVSLTLNWTGGVGGVEFA